jgi:putative FmdB family regulatory protein
MPTYTYRCTKCGSEFEVVQSMSDPPLKRCRNCRGALRRTFHPVGIVLKGSGFHRTDYRSKPPPSDGKSSDKKESSDAKSPATDSKSSSETKKSTSTAD